MNRSFWVPQSIVHKSAPIDTPLQKAVAKLQIQCEKQMRLSTEEPLRDTTGKNRRH